MTGLTTHVLDALHGAGAPGLRVDLSRFEGGCYRPLKTVHTREDGRAEMLDASAMVAGSYELLFHVAAYFAGRGVALPDPSFLQEVPVHFGIGATRQHYHVPLIVTPWMFSTYRGGQPPVPA
jgi:5-hydroxyisourate hydrolase